jgi:hypothetical protein
LHWFGEEITGHVSSRAVLNCHFIVLHSVRHEEVAYVDVSCSFTGRRLSVLFRQHCTLVVLVYLRFVYAVSLILQEVSCPNNLWHHASCSASVEPISSRLTLFRVTWFHLCVTFHIMVHSERCVHPPFHYMRLIRLKCQYLVDGFPEVFYSTNLAILLASSGMPLRAVHPVWPVSTGRVA